MLYLKLFLTFFEIGLFTFGGGYAMISLVREKVVMLGWLTEQEVINLVAVSESTPGPIAVNMATFVGSTQGGVWGSICATVGIVLPSFIIILLISALMKNFLKYKGVQAFLGGVRPCVVALICGTAATLFLSTLLGLSTINSIITPDYIGIGIFAFLVALGFVYKKIKGKKLSPIILIIISAIMCMAIYPFV